MHRGAQRHYLVSVISDQFQIPRPSLEKADIHSKVAIWQELFNWLTAQETGRRESRLLRSDGFTGEWRG